WERLDDLDTDEPLETNRSGAVPEQPWREGVPQDRFARDFYDSHAAAENQESDFVETSMPEAAPEMNAVADDFAAETTRALDGDPQATGIRGKVSGVVPGVGTTVPQDIGLGGFEVRDNPLVHAENPNLHPEDEEVGGEGSRRRCSCRPAETWLPRSAWARHAAPDSSC